MRQESDCLNASNNYAIGDTESEDNSIKFDHESEPEATEIDTMLAEIQK
ncbi:7187_t:CDS:2 [Funneliformis mosseae]|uniref:7187_t:CDS:1 n=1 Tax=Funneliformis mosseae TaxID=27381 RepID=A0A9N9GDH4_FUNMO|nr:7187_t:CDS:2 [Funneliformis mosseae]